MVSASFTLAAPLDKASVAFSNRRFRLSSLRFSLRYSLPPPPPPFDEDEWAEDEEEEDDGEGGLPPPCA